MQLATLTLKHITKKFSGSTVVDGVDLDVRSGEFFSILGPSGCGKTTLLRMIAGFETPTEGRILLDGKDITGLSPKERAIGMVFQNYALFPHMTVFGNVAFGPETKKVPRDEIRKRVGTMLEAVQLADKAEKPVPQLSGGEQQRVAVARALVVEPAVLLMDEPLSNLDVALRQSTREEIRSLQRQVKITTLYVTHDQSEAMSLSDRVAVMRAGKIVQVGSPAEVYARPVSSYVARFLGGATILRGTVDSGVFRTQSMLLRPPAGVLPSSFQEVEIAIRPEAVELLPEASRSELTAVVEEKEYLGFVTHVVLNVSGVMVRASSISSDMVENLVPGARVGIRFDWSRCPVFGVD